MEDIDFKRYAKPQYIAIVALAAVAGWYLMSKRKAQQSADEVPVTQVISTERPVQSSGSTQYQDDLQRQLSDAQQKLQNASNGGGSEPVDTSFWSAQIQQLQDALKQSQADTVSQAQANIYYQNKLRAQQGLPPLPNDTLADKEKANTPAVLLPGTSAPSTPNTPNVPEPVPSVPLPGTRPGTTPVPQPVVHRPGLPDGYIWDCSSAPQNLLYPTWESFKQSQTSKGGNVEQQARNLVSYALTGWGPLGGGATVGYILSYIDTQKPAVQASMNQARVRGGLLPLEDAGFVRLSNDLKAWYPLEQLNDKQRQAVFHDLSTNGYAYKVWSVYNLPYQCPTSKRRI